MNTESITDDEKAILTEEELAALDDSDVVETEDTDDNDDDDGDDASASEPAPAAEPAPAEPAAAQPEAEDDDDDVPPAQAPAGERLDPQAVQQKLDDIEKQRGELATKLDDGDLTTAEYTKALDTLAEQKHGITAQLAQQQTQDKAEMDRWDADCRKFLAKNAYLIENATRRDSFDGIVKRVTGDPANASLSNRKQLEMAHTLWREEMGLPAETPAKKNADPAPDPAPAAKPKPKAKVELPPTLAHVPAADINDTEDGKYAHLDALMAKDPVAYEAALARLSDADQDDYLSRA